MVASPVWHGTGTENEQLLTVIERHCECEWRGCVRLDVCQLHHMLTIQRVLDGLVFMRRQADRLRREEFAA